MVNMQALQDILEKNGNIVDREGARIGKVGQIYLDDQTNEPEWVTAATGLFGSSESFVPVKGAVVHGGEVAVAYGKDMVLGAPRIEAEGHLSAQQESELYAYYGLEHPGSNSAALRKHVGRGDGRDSS
ncbi:PRC-barrel domain-containing protein [Arthrobacter castelli]|uniref:PRC-barrel domain-containing protein n=1 Tax=Arthrobacter castelli TaxID=271431 RepID=UPI0003F8D5F2|nr:PRC-barrel domain-containing protein [Arthrobacter castelli]